MTDKFNTKSNSVGNTAVETLKVDICGYEIPVLIKREDLNPSGSFKDRSMKVWIEYYLSLGHHQFVISSTGNSAISAVYWSNYFNSNLGVQIKLTVFVSDKLDEHKKTRLEFFCKDSADIEIIQVKNPKSAAIKFANDRNAINLRGSTDDRALTGYESLGNEISTLDFTDLFMISSSGTSLLGLCSGLRLQRNMIRIHIFQVAQACNIYQRFTGNFKISSKSSQKITCISDKIGLRAENIIDILEETNGSVDILLDSDFELLKNVDLSKLQNYQEITENSLANLVGMLKYMEKLCKEDHKLIEKMKPLVIFTGK